MRLGSFIRTETEAIMRDWEVVAHALNQAQGLYKTGFQANAHDMLIAIAENIEIPQTDQAQENRLCGLSAFVYNPNKPELLPAESDTSGAEIQELVTLFQALRTSVIRRWIENNSLLSLLQIEDLVRFNNAVDRAVSLSLAHYSDSKERHTRLLTIAERERAEEKTWRDANLDPLTDLHNRRLFLDRLEQAIEHSARNGLPLAVMYIDLDDFKDINDTMGREVGDRILRDVAKRLRNCIRKADTAARQGGNEFAVILTDLYANRDMRAVAEKVSDALRVSFKDKQGTFTQISISIGITLCPKDGITAQDLLRNADRAMYKSKTSRRRPICFYGSAKTDSPQPDAFVH